MTTNKKYSSINNNMDRGRGPKGAGMQLAAAPR
jgi:hypothetical protein